MTAESLREALLHPPEPQRPIAVDDFDWDAASGEHSWFIATSNPPRSS